MLTEVQDAEGQIVLFLDELHTIVGGRCRRRRGRRLPTCSSRCWPAANCGRSVPRPSTSTASTSRRTRPSNGASSRSWSASPTCRTRSRSCAGSGRALRGPSRRPDRRLGDHRRRHPFRALHRRPLPAGQGDRPDRRSRLPDLKDRDRPMPTEIDEVERRISSSKSNARHSRPRPTSPRPAARDTLEEELAELNEKSSAMKARWQTGEGPDRIDQEAKGPGMRRQAARPNRPSAMPTSSGCPPAVLGDSRARKAGRRRRGEN